MDSTGPFRFTHAAMATVFEIVAYGPGEELVARVAERAFVEVDRIEERLSYYRPHSDVCRANREAHDHDVEVGVDFIAVVGAAQILHAATGGAFDPTVGPLMKCWRFHDGKGAMPAPEALAAARRVVGLRHVALDAERRAVRYAMPGVELDLGAIGKGYAVDKAVSVLRSYRIDRAVVHGGASSAYAMEPPPGESGWPFRLRAPRDPEKGYGEVVLRERAISGSAHHDERSFVAGGRRYGHELDPRTGSPAEGRAAAWALAPTATESDALSTAFFVFTPAETKAYCEANSGVEAIVLEEGRGHPLRFGLPPLAPPAARGRAAQ